MHDSTRDNSAAETDKSITLYEFEDIAEYNNEGRLYWIAFNGKISDIDFDSDEVFIITFINLVETIIDYLFGKKLFEKQ